MGFTPIQNPEPAVRAVLPPMGPVAEAVSRGLSGQLRRDSHCKECGAVLTNPDFAIGACPICKTGIEEMAFLARVGGESSAYPDLPAFNADRELGRKEWPADAPIW